MQEALFQLDINPEEPEGKDHKDAFKRIRNFLAGRFVGATRDESLLREVLRCLYTSLYLQKNPKKAQSLVQAEDGNVEEIATAYRQAFRQVVEAFPDSFEDGEEFLLDPVGLAYVMKELSGVPLIDSRRDAIGDAFEVFIGNHIRGQEGQFFTPKNAIDLLVKAVNPSLREAVIDPACGAGGFLSAILQHHLSNGVSSRKLANYVSKYLYGIDKDSYLVRLARTHLTLSASRVPNITCADSLVWRGEVTGSLDKFPQAGEYDIVLTNPPFGSNIVAATGSDLLPYKLARKWKLDKTNGTYASTNAFQKNVAPQVLFLERCIRLVKPGGRIGIVLPESLVSSKVHRYVMDFMRAHCYINLIAGMPEDLFKTSGKGGTHTKTCLVVLEKKRNKATLRNESKIFMAEARWCGHDSRGKEIPHDDLGVIAENYIKFRSGKRFKESNVGFLVLESEIVNHILSPRYYNPQVKSELHTLKKSHHLIVFKDLVDQGILELATGDEVGKLAYGTGDIPFVRTSDISNWEIKVDPKHGLSNEIFSKYSAKQDVQPGDILLVRDGTYLIGTCAMLTKHDKRIVYQSHIYKIRTHENDQGITPYLLLAVLSCEIVQKQIRAKRFTQDIIDSLGNRILELVLPIPKSQDQRELITTMVTRVIQGRSKARELSRMARKMVLKV